MADTRKITIEILSSESGSNDSKKGDKSFDIDNNNVGKTINKIIRPLESSEAATIGKTVILNQAYQQAKQLLTQSIDLICFSLKVSGR